MKAELQPFGDLLRSLPKGKIILHVIMPHRGSLTMAENEDGTWEIAARSVKGVMQNVTPPDAYGMLYPLFARNWPKEEVES